MFSNCTPALECCEFHLVLEHLDNSMNFCDVILICTCIYNPPFLQLNMEGSVPNQESAYAIQDTQEKTAPTNIYQVH